MEICRATLYILAGRVPPVFAVASSQTQARDKGLACAATADHVRSVGTNSAGDGEIGGAPRKKGGRLYFRTPLSVELKMTPWLQSVTIIDT